MTKRKNIYISKLLFSEKYECCYCIYLLLYVIQFYVVINISKMNSFILITNNKGIWVFEFPLAKQNN